MATVTLRTDAATDRALENLTADGTSMSDAIRSAVIAAERARIESELRAESARLADDEDDVQALRDVLADMDELRAW